LPSTSSTWWPPASNALADEQRMAFLAAPRSKPMRRSALDLRRQQVGAHRQLHVQQRVEAAPAQLPAQVAQAGGAGFLVEGDQLDALEAVDQLRLALADDPGERRVGHARCSVRTSGTVWVASPSADRRSRQIERGRGVHGGAARIPCMESRAADIGTLQRTAAAVSAMRAGRSGLCSTRALAASRLARVRARARTRTPYRWTAQGGRGALGSSTGDAGPR
jgi:hypothetical protein